MSNILKFCEKWLDFGRHLLVLDEGCITCQENSFIDKNLFPPRLYVTEMLLYLILIEY